MHFVTRCTSFFLFLVVVIQILDNGDCMKMKKPKDPIMDKQVYSDDQAEEPCGASNRTVHAHKAKQPQTEVVKGGKISLGKAHLKNRDNNDTTGGTDLGHEWPWEVRVMHDDRLLCSGVLVRGKWVLTSATCLAAEQTKFEKVQVELQDGTRFNASQMHLHSKFKKPRVEGNIGLLELSDPIPINNATMPICLPRTQAESSHGSECAVIMLTQNRTTKAIQHWESVAEVLSIRKCHKFAVEPKQNDKDLLCIGSQLGAYTLDKDEKRPGFKNPFLPKRPKRKYPCGLPEAPLFLMCKTSGLWGVFGIGTTCSQARDGNWSYGYFLKMDRYMEWAKDKIEMV